MTSFRNIAKKAKKNWK